MTSKLRCLALLGLLSVLAIPAGALPTAKVWVTDPFAADTRLAESIGVPGPGEDSPSSTFTVDPNFRDQVIGGFGASMTESSALVIGTLSVAARDGLMAEFFAPGQGLGLTFLRQPIGAPDFAASIFSNDDVVAGEDDFGLEHFSIERDRTTVLPLLRQARALQPNLLVTASPWSPPAWMKTGHTMLGASGGVLRDDCFGVYARYFARFIQGYAAEGVPIFSVTPQNEPAYGPAPYPGMLWPAAEEGRFIRDHLGPVLAAQAPGTLIWGWDHNYDGASYATALLDDPATGRWLAGTAWHDYGGTAVAVDPVRRAHPNQEIWMTEGGLGTWLGGFRTQFSAGIRQGIGALAHGSRSYVLWNLALDVHGGPVVFSNSANEGLVTIDQGRVTARNAGYYVLGQFTRAIAPGARRVGLTTDQSGVEGVAFENPDGSTAVVLANPYLNDQNVRVLVGTLTWDLRVPGQGAVTLLETP